MLLWSKLIQMEHNIMHNKLILHIYDICTDYFNLKFTTITYIMHSKNYYTSLFAILETFSYFRCILLNLFFEGYFDIKCFDLQNE